MMAGALPVAANFKMLRLNSCPVVDCICCCMFQPSIGDCIGPAPSVSCVVAGSNTKLVLPPNVLMPLLNCTALSGPPGTPGVPAPAFWLTQRVLAAALVLSPGGRSGTTQLGFCGPQPWARAADETEHN